MGHNAARPGPPSRTVSPDGNEVTWQTNYLAPVALTSALLDLMGNARPSRVFADHRVRPVKARVGHLHMLAVGALRPIRKRWTTPRSDACTI